MEETRPTIEQLQALESLEWVQTWHNMASEGCMVESRFGAIRDQLRRELLGDFIGMTVGISHRFYRDCTDRIRTIQKIKPGIFKDSSWTLDH